MADDLDTVVQLQLLQQLVHVPGQLRCRVTALGDLRVAHATQVDGDHGVLLGEWAHLLPPLGPRLGETVDQHHRRTFAASQIMHVEPVDFRVLGLETGGGSACGKAECPAPAPCSRLWLHAVVVAVTESIRTAISAAMSAMILLVFCIRVLTSPPEAVSRHASNPAHLARCGSWITSLNRAKRTSSC